MDITGQQCLHCCIVLSDKSTTYCHIKSFIYGMPLPILDYTFKPIFLALFQHSGPHPLDGASVGPEPGCFLPGPPAHRSPSPALSSAAPRSRGRSSGPNGARPCRPVGQNKHTINTQPPSPSGDLGTAAGTAAWQGGKTMANG